MVDDGKDEGKVKWMQNREWWKSGRRKEKKRQKKEKEKRKKKKEKDRPTDKAKRREREMMVVDDTEAKNICKKERKLSLQSKEKR